MNRIQKGDRFESRDARDAGRVVMVTGRNKGDKLEVVNESHPREGLVGRVSFVEPSVLRSRRWARVSR